MKGLGLLGWVTVTGPRQQSHPGDPKEFGPMLCLPHGMRKVGTSIKDARPN